MAENQRSPDAYTNLFSRILHRSVLSTSAITCI
jgi:hypothetical protein